MSATVATDTAPDDGDVRARLSREQIVDEALALADRLGLEELTLRKLAVQLGVTPMALYWHLRDKDALLDALGERLFASIELPAPVDDWFKDLTGVSHAITAGLRRHLAIAPLALSSIVTSEAGLVISERVLSLLVRGGLSDEDAANAGAFFLHGVVALLGSIPGALPESRHATAARLRARVADSIDLSSFPVVSRMAPHLLECDDQDGFIAQGIEILLLGIRGLVERAPAP
ncbi:MAG: TetR/AcrR family transcriptional regulator C-terminal domain-containing protein [Acidimicrobiales bacterium]